MLNRGNESRSKTGTAAVSVTDAEERTTGESQSSSHQVVTNGHENNEGEVPERNEEQLANGEEALNGEGPLNREEPPSNQNIDTPTPKSADRLRAEVSIPIRLVTPTYGTPGAIPTPTSKLVYTSFYSS